MNFSLGQIDVGPDKSIGAVKKTFYLKLTVVTMGQEEPRAKARFLRDKSPPGEKLVEKLVFLKQGSTKGHKGPSTFFY